MKLNYVGVYGTLKKGFRNHKHLVDAKYVGKSYIKCYGIANSITNYPEARLVGQGKFFWLLVEIYAVDELTLFELDELEEVPHLFQRINVQTDKNETILAYTSTKIIEYKDPANFVFVKNIGDNAYERKGISNG